MSGIDPKRRAVIIMAKRPVPGASKTRLTPRLSPNEAAGLYELFLLDTIAAVAGRNDCTPVLAIDAEESGDYFASIAPGIQQVQQVGAGLGERLGSVMVHCTDLGFEQVFALGSDSPDLPNGHLGAAFAALSGPETDLVFGPSDDGGYYLIGWKQPWPSVVTNVVMSTATVLEETLKLADGLGLRVDLAPQWYDVDEPADLDRLRASLAGSAASLTARYLAGC